jgi:hypothetical protein
MTGFNVGVGGAWKTGKPFVGDGGVWKAVQAGYVGVGGVWKQFYTGFSVTVAPNPATWQPDGGSGFEVPLGLIATVTGGVGPFTYLWTSPDPNAVFFPATNSSIIPFSSTGDPVTLTIAVMDSTSAVAVGTVSLSQ